MIFGCDWVHNDGVVCVYQLSVLCSWYVLKTVVCVGIAEVLTRVHVLICEYVEFVEFLFKSGLWNSLCMEYDLCQGDYNAIKEVWCG